MILITGGMGYLGLHTARYLLDAGEDVVITRYSTWREPSFIKDEFGKRVLLEKVDVTSPNDVMRAVRAHKVTGIVHMAVPALGGLTPAEEYRVNTVGLLNVLDAAANSDVKRVSLASSVAVYSSVPEGPFHEDIPLPMTSKSGTETFKKGFEVHANYVADRTGLDVALLRINVNFGPLYHSMSQSNSRICHAAARGTEPDYTGSATGQPYEEDGMDMHYVKNTAYAISLLQLAEKLPHRTYNIGAGRRVTFKELVAAVKLAAPDAKVTLPPGHRPDASGGRVPLGLSNYMTIDRLVEDLGYSAPYSVEQGIAEYIGWLRENPY